MSKHKKPSKKPSKPPKPRKAVPSPEVRAWLSDIGRRAGIRSGESRRKNWSAAQWKEKGAKLAAARKRWWDNLTTAERAAVRAKMSRAHKANWASRTKAERAAHGEKIRQGILRARRKKAGRVA